MLQEAFVWTDGSVIDNDHCWTRTLGCAIVDENGSKVFAAACIDPRGCTFKAELQAVLYAAKTDQNCGFGFFGVRKGNITGR